MGIRINWNAVTAVCAIFVAVFTASGWLTDGIRADIRDLRQDIAEIREDVEVLQQDVAFIKGRILPDPTTTGNPQRPDSGK